MRPNKPESETVENCAPSLTNDPATHHDELVMRNDLDDLTVWQSVLRFKSVGWVAMLAAFSASLDGYREFFLFPEIYSVLG